VIQRLLPFLSLIVLFVALSIASPHFLTETNLSSVVRQTAVINIMGLGMTMIIIAGGIDLSVGSILGMGGLLGTMAMEHGAPIPASVAIGVPDRTRLRTIKRRPHDAIENRPRSS
jgi:ribose transport system permease protein